MSRNSTRLYRQKNNGFSLIEMVVAIAILGISLGMLYQAAGGATRSVKVSEDYAYAVSIAQSLLALHNTAPPDGVSLKDETADGYRWSVQTSELALAEDTDQPTVYAIEVTVQWGQERNPRSFVLSSVVPVMEVIGDR